MSSSRPCAAHRWPARPALDPAGVLSKHDGGEQGAPRCRRPARSWHRRPLARVGAFQFGVSITLSDGREATWDSDGTAALEAQVMRNGVLVGYVPAIEGSDSYTEQQIIDAILRTDYDEPIAYQRPKAPPPAPPLPRKGGLFRRFIDGFRYR